ncbi:MAG: Ig-like domain-containing protein [Prevotella sp.]|nr:Ig-like domain-containing protein [Prevotella sp.]
MKQKLRVLCTLLLCMIASVGWAEDVSVTFTMSQQGYTNGIAATKITSNGVSIDWHKGTGSNVPAYYTNGNAVRLYKGNTIEISSTNGNLKSITFTCVSNYAKLESASTGTITTNGNVQTWISGNEEVSEVVVNNNTTSNDQTRITAITVVYSSSSSGPIEPTVTLSPLSIAIDETATGTYLEELTDFTVSSSNSSVATATAADGVITVTGVAAGSATITAEWSATDSYTAGPKTFDITVTKITPTVTFESGSVTMMVGETFTNILTDNTNGALTYQYSSSDNTVAEVSSAGVVTGKKVGTATITATWNATERYANGSATYQITVATAGSDAFELVTDASDLTAGDEIIIVNADATFAISKTQNTNNRKATSVTVDDDNTITPSSEVEVITLEGQSGAWNFSVTGGYLYAASGSSNYMKTESSVDENGNANAAITISDGIATVVFQGTNTRNTLRYNPNNGNPMFSCYAENTTTGTAVCIYKKPSTSQKADAGLEFSEETVNVNVGEATTVTFTKETTATVNVVNSDESVATYNIETGLVTALNVGTTTITATSPANDNYKAGTATFTITVVDPNALEAIFNFDDDYETLFPSLTGTSSGSGDNYISDGDITEDLTATVSNVALTVSAGVHVEGEQYFNNNRIWSSEPRLRMYSGTLTIVAPAGYEITEMEFNQGKWNNGNTANVGTLTNAGWTGNAETIVISIAGNTQFSSINVKYTVKAAPETITVNINKNASDASGLCYGTLYYSKLNLVVPEGLTAYTYKVTDGTLTESKTYAIGEVIPAGTAVVVKTSAALTENTDYDFAVTTEAGVADDDNMLHGTDGAATTNAGEGNWKYYALSLNSSNTPGTVGFYYRKGCPNGEAFQNGAHKAYLAVPVAQAKGMSGFAFDDAVTAISGVAFDAETNNAAIYNLNGQRVNKAQKGIYIVNGKKVVIR